MRAQGCVCENYRLTWRCASPHKHKGAIFYRSIFWPCLSCLFSPQTIALHQKLHPHAPICVLHAESYQYFRERCCALLWIGVREHGKSHSGSPQVHPRGSASQQNTVRKYTNTAHSVLEEIQREGKTELHPKEDLQCSFIYVTYSIHGRRMVYSKICSVFLLTKSWESSLFDGWHAGR